MKLRVIRILLWLIRQLGFALDFKETPGAYQWVASPTGSFDHWFYYSDGKCSVGSAVREFGFWPLIWKILRDSKLPLGRRRWNHKEIIRQRSERYYCAPPLRDQFAADALVQFLAADPSGDVLAQTAAAYRVADAMMDARIGINHYQAIPHPAEDTKRREYAR